MLHATGSLLTVDVRDRTADTEDIEDELRAFIGGRGVATKLAHDRIPFDADPLGPENRVYISSGPLQQSDMSFTGRMNMTGVSPLTGGLLSSNAGGTSRGTSSGPATRSSRSPARATNSSRSTSPTRASSSRKSRNSRARMSEKSPRR